MVTINVYMQDGRVFSYDVDDVAKAREHCHRIINYGWRNTEGDMMCYYPVHQVLKATFNMKNKDTLAEKYSTK